MKKLLLIILLSMPFILVGQTRNEYYENGKIKYERTYKNNKKHGIEKFYNEQGVLLGKISWKNGVQEGMATSYYDNGNIMAKANFVNGKISGVVKEYFEEKNGLIKGETPHDVNGRMEGTGKEYRIKNGKHYLFIYVVYKNDKVVSYYHPESKARFSADEVNSSNEVKKLPIITENGMHYVLIKLGNKKYKYLIDTGASEMTINTEIKYYLSSIGILRKRNYIGKEIIQTADGKTHELYVAILPSMSIGNDTFSDIKVYVGDQNMSLLLGMGFLSRYDWKINNRYLELRRK